MDDATATSRHQQGTHQYQDGGAGRAAPRPRLRGRRGLAVAAQRTRHRHVQVLFTTIQRKLKQIRAGLIFRPSLVYDFAWFMWGSRLICLFFAHLLPRVDCHPPLYRTFTCPANHAARKVRKRHLTLTHRGENQRSLDDSMRRAQAAAFLLLAAAVTLLAAAEGRRHKDGEKACDKGWECSGSRFCCNETITDYFKVHQFEEFFARHNESIAHAAGFWDYQAFIAAAALFEPRGFGTTGGKDMSMKEVAAFLGHVGAGTSCGYGSPDPVAWGLCYYHELSPAGDSYCDDSNELYRCVEGVKYYARGALPIYWNYNYGIVGKGIKQDLLSHPELLEQNATLAFEAAIWRWMTPRKRKQPSAHDVFVGNWKPTKNDTLSQRYPGFGATMNIMYGDRICGRGFIHSMNSILSHYQHYLDLMGVGREHSGDNLDCAEQLAFNKGFYF